VIGLFKAEEIYRRGPWKGLEDVEFATLEWVAWYNGRRLLAPLGCVPPVEFEQAYHDRQAAPAELAVLVTRSLENPERFSSFVPGSPASRNVRRQPLTLSGPVPHIPEAATPSRCRVRISWSDLTPILNTSYDRAIR
jgi:hypothetical protein